jgi:hypothetical protein
MRQTTLKDHKYDPIMNKVMLLSYRGGFVHSGYMSGIGA